MELNKDVMQAVEALDYRVTVGDVAARAGLNIATAQQGLLTLASETQGHMQVSDTGEIAYEFPRNFQGILRNKYWQLRFRETLSKIWQVVFYIIRLSFGVMLLVSIAIIFIAIFALMIAASSQGGAIATIDAAALAVVSGVASFSSQVISSGCLAPDTAGAGRPPTVPERPQLADRATS